MKMEQLEVLIKNIQEDPRRVRLLGILGQQLELLINSGQPDIAQLFTLLKEKALVSEALEINEREGKIFHYDSMAARDVIEGRMKPTRVEKEEFGRLGFEYLEAATPQQTDGHSCGPMVIRNARLRMNGLYVGDWGDKLNAERLRLEIVDAFRSCVSDGAIWKRLRK